VRARQVARPDRPRPFRGLEVPQDFEGLREFFRRYGHGRLPLGFVFPLSNCVASYLDYCAVPFLSYLCRDRNWSRPLGCLDNPGDSVRVGDVDQLAGLDLAHFYP
jgi:hypothetical protein